MGVMGVMIDKKNILAQSRRGHRVLRRVNI